MSDHTIDESTRIKLGNFIRDKREQKNIGMNQLGVKIDVTKSLISKLENGLTQKISPFLLQKIAKGLGIDYKELYKIVGYLDEEYENYKEKSNIKRIIQAEDIHSVEVPVYGKASAGNGYINLGEVIRTKLITLLRGEELPEGVFTVEVHGESMYPAFLEDDLVLVDPNCEVIKNNKVYVVTYNEETFIKRIIDHGKYLQLISENPDKIKYKDIIISKEEEGVSFKCNGRVIKLVERLY